MVAGVACSANPNSPKILKVQEEVVAMNAAAAVAYGVAAIIVVVVVGGAGCKSTRPKR